MAMFIVERLKELNVRTESHPSKQMYRKKNLFGYMM